MRNACSILAFLTLASPAALGQVDFPALTDNRRDVTNLNVEPVRGMEQASDGTLWAINSHGSQIIHHMDLGAAPEEVFATVHLPVSIALWGDDYIVVAGAGTHALALHERNGGALVNLLQLPSEPADLVIDHDLDVALVACQGENVVVKVDLNTFTEIVRYQIPAERPRFLFFDRGTDMTSDNRVFVTPFISGNNSTTQTASIAGDIKTIVDLDGLPASAQLPDEDLFEIDVNSNSPTAAVAVKRRVGTLLTAHGRHPDGAYWVLNTESINKDPARQSEPLLKGDFAKSRLWIGTPSTSNLTTTPGEFTDLDLPAGTGGYSVASSVAFPFGLAFDPSGSGQAFITSPLADCVSIRDSAGAVAGRINLPDGSIPMGVELDWITNQLLFVYCWGTNEIRVILVANPSVVFPLQLGLDPTPEPIRRGRRLWYDGHRSLNARSSCNTCHPGGKSDFLGWQVSDHPSDRKDVMVTQSLLGIEDTFPYHWRGERALIDFNGAFVGLLGGAAPLSTDPILGEPGIEFEDFQAFVFSLQPHANPFEDLSRTVVPTMDPTPTGILGDAVAGVSAFTTVSGFTGRTCVECHIGQSGSSGDFTDDNGFILPSAKHLEVAHLRELTHKNQPDVPLTLGPVTQMVSRSGFGTGHNGTARSLFNFVEGGSTFNLTPSQVAHVAAFLKRFDQGIAPTAHEARMLDSAHPSSASEIANLLIPQALASPRWIDLVAFGTFVNPATGLPRTARWWFNPASGLFDCDDSGVASQPLSTFTAAGTLAQTSMVFLGVPPSNGFRLGLDVDNDGLITSAEIAAGTLPFVADTDGDGQPDGYEVLLGSNPLLQSSVGVDTVSPTGTVVLDFVSASLAKLVVVASEEVTVSASFRTLGGALKSSASPVLARTHTVVLQGLEPSTQSGLPGIPGQTNTAICTLTLTDRAGRRTPIVITPFNVGEMILIPQTQVGRAPMVIESLAGNVAASGTMATITATVAIGQRHMRPGVIEPAAANSRMVVFEALVESPSGSGVFVRAVPTTSLGTFLPVVTTQTGPIDPSIMPGNYVATPLTSTVAGVPGSATVDVTLSGVSSGQRVKLQVIAILEPNLPLGNPIVFTNESTSRYQFPPTRPANRGLDLVVP